MIRSAEHLTDCLLALLFAPFEAMCRTTSPLDPVDRYEREAIATLREVGVQLNFNADEVLGPFLAALPEIYEKLLEDADALDQSDPAATSTEEVILTYPGFRAVAVYRLANVLARLGVPLLPRMMAEICHRDTGIDIHPKATIGRAFSIDHGTGLVIGETALIGDRVKLYQGVTPGASSVSKALAATKRHPTLEHDVIVYANATILGGETVIGAGSVIGGNVWLTRSVPPRSLVTRDEDPAAIRPLQP
jgi:serine O-acetyltransferase